MWAFIYVEHIFRELVMIFLSIKEEMKSLVAMQLKHDGYNNINPDEVMEQYFNACLRKITPKPRKIEKSKEFVCPAGFEKKLQYFESVVLKGEDVKPFMTTKMLNASYKDKMLSDWGLYHFHLADSPYTKDNRFMDRSDQLLIAYIDLNDDGTIYFIQIVPHKKINLWTTQDFIRCLADNWPQMMERYRIPGMAELDTQIDDKAYAELRDANINTMVDLGDGRVYCGSNFGLTGAGYSLRTQLGVNSLHNNAMLVEKIIIEKNGEITAKINECASKPLKDVTLHLQAFRNADYFFEISEEPNVTLLVRLFHTAKGYDIRYTVCEFC